MNLLQKIIVAIYIALWIVVSAVPFLTKDPYMLISSAYLVAILASFGFWELEKFYNKKNNYISLFLVVFAWALFVSLPFYIHFCWYFELY